MWFILLRDLTMDLSGDSNSLQVDVHLFFIEAYLYLI